MRKINICNFIKPAGNILIPSILFLGVGIVNFLALIRDNITPVHDALVTYSYSRYFFSIINDWDALRSAFFTNINNYPPLYMLLPLPFYAIFGATYRVMAMTNLIYIAILLYSIYKTADYLNDPAAGLFSCVFLLFFPSIIGFSRVTHHTIAVTAFTALSIYLLLRTRLMQNKKFTFTVFPVLITGILISPEIIIHVSFPLLILTIFSIKKKPRALLLFFGFLSAALLLTLFVFLVNPSPKIQLPWRIFFFFNIYSYPARVWEQLGILKDHILLPFTVFFAAMLFVKSRLKKHHLAVLYSWIVLPILAWALLSFDELVDVQPRFILPVLPAVAVLAGVKFSSLLETLNLKKITVISVFLFILGGLNLISFSRRHPRPKISSELLNSRSNYGMLHIFNTRNPAEDLLYSLKRDMLSRGVREKPDILIIFEDSRDPAPLVLEFINYTIGTHEYSIHNPVSLSVKGWGMGLTQKETIELMHDYFNNAGYILYITNTSDAVTLGRGEYYKHYNFLLKEKFYSIKEDLEKIWVFRDDFFTEKMFLFKT